MSSTPETALEEKADLVQKIQAAEKKTVELQKAAIAQDAKLAAEERDRELTDALVDSQCLRPDVALAMKAKGLIGDEDTPVDVLVEEVRQKVPELFAGSSGGGRVTCPPATREDFYEAARRALGGVR